MDEKIMDEKIKKLILSIVKNDGFDYTFNYYRSFNEIKDEEFHQLRQEYKIARRNLAKYIGFND